MELKTVGRPPSQEEWDAITTRSTHMDGRFLFAVRTTGVYCRPSCPARRPLRQNVVLFEAAASARSAGFRACRRCAPDAATNPSTALGERAQARLLRLRPGESIRDVAAELKISPRHLARVVADVSGATPGELVRAARRTRVAERLRGGATVREAAYAAGHRSTGPLYASGASGTTPAEYRDGGPSELHITTAPSALGTVLVAATARGVCAVRIGDEVAKLESEVRREFPRATILQGRGLLAPILQEVLRRLEGRAPRTDVALDVRATAFQARVWDELRRIPPGSTKTYAEVAAALGAPGSARAVARACAANPVALLTPCHRVVGSDGGLRGFRWGVARKRRLLDSENAAAAAGNEPQK